MALLILAVLVAELASPIPVDARSLDTLAIACVPLGGAAWRVYRLKKFRASGRIACATMRGAGCCSHFSLLAMSMG